MPRHPVSTWLCVFGSVACVALFATNPVPDNQFCLIAAAACLFFAYVCYDSRIQK